MPLSKITSNGLSVQSITAGTYGSSNTVPVVTVGTDGRISAVSNTAISGAYLTNSNNSIITTNTSITGNVTIASNTGGLTIGPAIISANQTVTVSANARWVVL
mgnify:CR=1 FL=1